MAGTRGDSDTAEAVRPVTEVEFPFAAVDLAVAIMVLWRGLASVRGSGESRARWGGGRVEARDGIVNFVAECTLRVNFCAGGKNTFCTVNRA